MPRIDPLARKEYATKYAEEHKAELRAYGAAYRAKNKDRIAAKRAERAHANREYAKKYRTEQKAEAQKTKKQYVDRNRGAINAYVASRRVDKIQRTPAWLTDFDRLKIKCIYAVAAMLTKHNNEPWHVDHVIPLRGKNVSGLHVPANLRVIRGEENMAKHNSFEVVHA